jgi:hypothetical protein
VEPRSAGKAGAIPAPRRPKRENQHQIRDSLPDLTSVEIHPSLDADPHRCRFDTEANNTLSCIHRLCPD